jgi:peptidoglycan-associated lipoprotein
MNLLSKKICLILASTLVVFAGCTKKPKRPSPDQTVLGQQGGPNNGLSASDANGLGATDASAAGLQARPDGVIETDDMIRNLLQPVYFDFDKFGIKESERAKLQAAKDYLDKNPTQRLLLEGHCDWRGTAEYNLGLGERRAGAGKSYLEKLGVAADKLQTTSKGSLEAKEKGTDEEMTKDRRVDLVILKK